MANNPPLARIFAGESDKVLVGPAPGVLEEFRWLKVPTGEKWTDLSGVTDGVLATGATVRKAHLPWSPTRTTNGMFGRGW